MNRIFIVICLTLVALTGGERGLRPRSSPAEYAGQQRAADVVVAASALSPDQVKAAFTTDLRHYLVIEVGIFPENGTVIDLSPADFELRIGGDNGLIRSGDPGAIAAAIDRKNAPTPQRRSEVAVYPAATVGIESGTDPVTGRRVHGVYTDTSVGVGVEPTRPPYPPPGSMDPDREFMRAELIAKSLPEGKTGVPVAGYLYFPLTKSARTASLELQYLGETSKVHVFLPAAKRK